MSSHNHGAAVSGSLSEKEFKKQLVSNTGFNFLKTRKEFVSYYSSLGKNKKEIEEIYNAAMLLPYPESWNKLKTAKTNKGKNKRFIPDGYIPEINSRIELKFTQQFGTTEEKVMADKEKIVDGVYNDKKLIYIFYGPIAEEQFWFELFKMKVEQFDPNSEKIKVFLANTLQPFFDYLKTLKTEG
jgi:hypothetical protein